MSKYSEASAIRSLSKKKASISIDERNKVIEIIRDNTEVGISSWGKIDYLTNYHGYIYVIVNKFTRGGNPSPKTNEDISIINEKVAKRERKLNMAKMVKSAMKAIKK